MALTGDIEVVGRLAMGPREVSISLADARDRMVEGGFVGYRVTMAMVLYWSRRVHWRRNVWAVLVSKAVVMEVGGGGKVRMLMGREEEL